MNAPSEVVCTGGRNVALFVYISGTSSGERVLIEGHKKQLILAKSWSRSEGEKVAGVAEPLSHADPRSLPLESREKDTLALCIGRYALMVQGLNFRLSLCLKLVLDLSPSYFFHSLSAM